MTQLEFIKSTPVLYGWIMDNGVQRIGSFRPLFNKYTNSVAYAYYTPKGNKGKGGFTIGRGFTLLEKGQLSTNPDKGDPNNYIG